MESTTPQNSKEIGRVEPLLGLLDVLGGGAISMTLNGKPLANIDADSKKLGVELQGIKESGIRARDLLKGVGGKQGAGMLRSGISGIRDSEKIARGLSEKGWSLSLNDKGEEVIAMGRGTSRAFGYTRVKILKLGKLLELL